MRMRLAVVTAAALAAAPAALAAQGFGVAGRIGTLGIGAEGALGLGPSFVVRAGLGLMPFSPSTTIDDIDFELSLPDTWFNVGGDLYLGGSGFRIGGGLLVKPDDPTLVGELTEGTRIEIGDQDYGRDQVSALEGTIDSRNTAPYFLIGFGKHTSSGVGLFLDVGAAVLGEPEVRLSAKGDRAVVESDQFQAELRKQEQRTEDDIGSYLNFWPIINLGVKIGLGG